MGATPHKFIKTIEIKNFKTHKDTIINLSPGVNMITGENSSGKTAVFRLLRFLFYGKPRDANKYVRYGTDHFYIKVTMNDGSWVERRKGKKINQYVLFDKNIHSEPLVLDSVGITVPDEVFNITGVSSVKLSNNVDLELNISGQHDAAFMLSETNPTIARWMYSLSGIDDVSTAISSLNRDYRSHGIDLKARQERIIEMKKDLKIYDDIDLIASKTNSLDKKIAKVKRKTDHVEKIKPIHTSLLKINEQLVPIKNNISILTKLHNVISNKDEEEIDSLIDSIIEIENIQRKIEKINKSVIHKDEIDNMIDIVNTIDLESNKNDMAIVIEIMSVYKKINSNNESYSKLNNNIKKTNNKINSIDKQIEEIQSSIFVEEDGVKICPLCKSTVEDDEVIEHIMEGL